MSAIAEEKGIEHRLTAVEEKHFAQSKRFGERLDAHDRSFEKINEKIEDIVKLLSARPTWLIVMLLTGLTNVTVGLIVYVSTHH